MNEREVEEVLRSVIGGKGTTNAEVEAGLRPDLVVGAPWAPNCRKPGAQRVACSGCGAFVALHPRSQAVLKANPGVPVACFFCARDRARVFQGVVSR